MVEIVWTEPAFDDLNEITAYIALSNPTAAKKLFVKIKNAVSRLEQFPDSGRVPPELTKFIYREVIVNPCRIFYQVDGDKVFIVRVIRQERDLRNYLIQESATEYVLE